MINKLLPAIVFLGIGFLFSTGSFAQSSENPTELLPATKESDNFSGNLDLAPPLEEKPHIIGNDGEKIYFLTDPLISKERKEGSDNNDEVQKNQTLQPKDD